MPHDSRFAIFSERRLERACQYVSDMWFPVNKNLLVRLRETASSGSPSDLDPLLQDLKGDFSLFLYCLRELHKLLEKEGVQVPSHYSPMEVFKLGGLERLSKILSLSDPPGSRHSLDAMSPHQRDRLEETVISASTSQILAEQMQINKDLGFSTALLRQLGYTLIAWNYPDAYQKALGMISIDVSLDAALTQILGFSPSVLGVTLARRWGISADICEAMREDIDTLDRLDPESLEDAVEASAVGNSLKTLCRVGEALARANAPETYPSARLDWETAKGEIFHRIGENGLQLIQDAVEEICGDYLVAVPELFKAGAIADAEIRLDAFQNAEFASRNPYVKGCRTFIRKKLARLYETIQAEAPIEECVGELVRQIIPESGFSGGWVYSIEPSTSLLIPQLKISAPRFRKAAPLACEGEEIMRDVVLRALHGDTSYYTATELDNGNTYTCFAGYLGFSQRIGVLYLEIPDLLLNGSEGKHLTHFRAFCLALNDSLRLG